MEIDRSSEGAALALYYDTKDLIDRQLTLLHLSRTVGISQLKYDLTLHLSDPNNQQRIAEINRFNIAIRYEAMLRIGNLSPPNVARPRIAVDPRITTSKQGVFDIDTLVAAAHFAGRGGSCLVLNMANFDQIGGGVRNGHRAQEEELFRRTDYFTKVSLHDKLMSDRHVNFGSEQIVMENEGDFDVGNPNVYHFLLTPNVRVLTNIDGSTIPPSQIFNVDMLACAADHLNDPSKLNVVDAEARISNIFEFAKSRGYKTLILGALGCGVYNNPPEKIAEIFRDTARQFNNFDHVVYAVKAVGKNGQANFETFSKVIN